MLRHGSGSRVAGQRGGGGARRLRRIQSLPGLLQSGEGLHLPDLVLYSQHRNSGSCICARKNVSWDSSVCLDSEELNILT